MRTATWSPAFLARSRSPEMKCQGQLGAAKRRKHTHNKQKATRTTTTWDAMTPSGPTRWVVFFFEEKRSVFTCCAPLWHCQAHTNQHSYAQTKKPTKKKKINKDDGSNWPIKLDGRKPRDPHRLTRWTRPWNRPPRDASVFHLVLIVTESFYFSLRRSPSSHRLDQKNHGCVHWILHEG